MEKKIDFEVSTLLGLPSLLTYTPHPRNLKQDKPGIMKLRLWVHAKDFHF